MSDTCNCNANAVTNCCPVAPEINLTQNIIEIDGDEYAFDAELFSVDAGTISGGTTITLASTPVSNGNVHVFRNGLLQRATTDYTISGVTITLLVAAVAGDVIQVRYLGAV